MTKWVAKEQIPTDRCSVCGKGGVTKEWTAFRRAEDNAKATICPPCIKELGR